MSYRRNGSIIGKRNVPTTDVASGVWGLSGIRDYLEDGIWPDALEYPGGNQSFDDLYAMVQDMANFAAPATPTAGGTLTINSESLGSYDYVIKGGNQTVSSFTNGDWFTATEDSRSAFVVVKGDLTINSGQVFRPANRKLFTVVYVTGDLTVNGEMSMTARGANHTADDGNVSAAAIRIATGTFSSVTNPQIPAAGASGASGVGAGSPGNDGSNGSSGQTGGGASGATSGGGSSSGNGADGTSFSGGSASGAGRSADSDNAEANGGFGSDGAGSGSGGGAGNPGGSGFDDGDDGTGGVLVIICEGTLSGTGSISANGATGGDADSGTEIPSGGGSGGGSVTVLYGTDSGPTPTATGGDGGTGNNGRDGGNGGDGTARKLALAA